MTSRLATYKKQDGGATQLRCEFVNNSLKAEKCLLAELNKLVVENKLKKIHMVMNILMVHSKQ